MPGTRALEELVLAVKDDVHNLSIRMLWHRQDAEDASQEILLKVVTHLGTFRGESTFSTWVHRIATNHLLNVRKSRVKREAMTFDRFGEQLADGLDEIAAPEAAGPDQALLEEEVKIGGTHGMLLCLDRDDRIAYVLGDVFGMRSEDAAEVLGVTPPSTPRQGPEPTPVALTRSWPVLPRWSESRPPRRTSRDPVD